MFDHTQIIFFFFQCKKMGHATQTCSTMLIGALRLVTALAWNSVVKDTIDKSNINPLIGGWLYALLLTFILVLIGSFISDEKHETI
jgi:F0F1-type ATP synthase assembly protein I